MHILIVDNIRQDRDLACRYLQPCGHDVIAVADVAEARAAVDRKVPEVVVLDWALIGSAQLVQRLRRVDDALRPYVLAVSASGSGAELTASVAAGADDFMRKPLTREELVLRVGALDRIRVWAAKVFGGTGGSVRSETTTIAGLAAWRSADRSISNDIGQLLGQPLEVSHGDHVAPEDTLAAQIPMTIAVDQTEVRLTVSADAGSLRRLGDIVLGDPAAPEDALRDLLREFANTAGGGFIRAAAVEGIALTTGLPTDVCAGKLAARTPTAQQRFVMGPADGSVRVTFELEVLPRALRRVTVGQVVEGMVLARDLRSDAGALLVPAGTRLTMSQIERLSRALSPRAAFDVVEST